MSPKSVIFLSAVSRELGSARELVANTLKSVGCKPEWQDIFATSQGDLRAMLRQRIDSSQGVVQLVGQCYGAEFTTPCELFGRVSYTQYEALYARHRGKQVWYLFLDDTFPSDPHEQEPDELRALQITYRELIRADAHVYHPLTSVEGLEESVLKLCDNLARLRRGLNRATGSRSDYGKPRAHPGPSWLKRAIHKLLPKSVPVDSSEDAGMRHGDKESSISTKAEESRQNKPDESPDLPVNDSMPCAQSIDDDVKFTVYRPQTMAPEEWSPWLIFAHRSPLAEDEPDFMEEVRNQARTALGKDFARYEQEQNRSSAALPRESTITVVPNVDGLRFNPTSRSFQWTEPVHKEEFRAKADACRDGATLRGRVTFYLGALVIAEVNVVVLIGKGASNRKQVPDSARTFRKIFVSYSRLDLKVVEHIEAVGAGLGDRYLRDLRDIRSGEVWSERLEQMIEEADIFQLFWSSNSMRSRHVRQEWEYALMLGRQRFIRPSYWECPFPKDEATGIPPEALSNLHFERIPSILPGIEPSEIFFEGDGTDGESGAECGGCRGVGEQAAPDEHAEDYPVPSCKPTTVEATHGPLDKQQNLLPRKSRVQIEYQTEHDADVGGSARETDLPWVTGTMADLSAGSADALNDRTFVDLDAENFDANLKSQAPSTNFDANNLISGKGRIGPDVTFEMLEDFTPELHSRWNAGGSPPAPNMVGTSPIRFLPPAREMPPDAIFISYSSYDLDAVKRLKSGLDEHGFNPWFNLDQLATGDDYHDKIHRNILNCSYFVLVISAASLARDEVFRNREWDWAIERCRGMGPGAIFVLPVIVDDTPAKHPRITWLANTCEIARLPGGFPDGRFVERLAELIKPNHV